MDDYGHTRAWQLDFDSLLWEQQVRPARVRTAAFDLPFGINPATSKNIL